jgi:hypothetical protein
MNKNKIFLILIFLFVLFFRLYFVFQVDSFSGDDAYFHLRAVDYIKEHIKFLYYDELSFNGNYILSPMLFHYFLALFSIPLLLKIIPELLFALFIFIVYFICKEITKDERAALISALISGFIPLVMSETLNQISIYSLVFPVMFLMFYFLLKLKDRKYLTYFILLSFMLPFIHASSFIFVFSVLIYLLLSFVEDFDVSKLKKETILFSCFLILLINFIIFKKAFAEYGLMVFLQNIPEQLFNNYFRNVNILESLYYVGIPLAVGSFGIYYGIFKENQKSIFLFSSIALTCFILLAFKLIDFNIGLMFVGVNFSILGSIAIKRFFDYIEITKLHKFKNYFLILILILVLFFSVIPCISAGNKVLAESLEERDLEALLWLEENSKKDSVVLGALEDGNKILAIAKRKSVIDSSFLLVKDINLRLDDVENIYKTGSSALASEILDRYGVNYIYLSENVMQDYGIDRLRYEDDENCFKEIKENLYEFLC